MTLFSASQVSVEPFVGKNLIDSKTLGRIFLEHASDNIFGILAETAHKAVFLQVKRLKADASLALFAVVVPKGKLGRKKHSHDGADAPDITAKAVRLGKKNFWGQVAWSTNLEAGCFISRLELGCAAEVGKTQRSFFSGVAHQDVFNFDVAVDNVTGVKCLYTFAELSNNALSMFLVKGLFFLLADVVEEVACRHEFCHDIVCDFVLEGLNKLNNVLAIHASHLLADLELLESLIVLVVCPLDFVLLDYLDGNLDLRVFMLGKHNKAERSLAEFAKGFILVNSCLPEALCGEDLLVPVLH